MQTNGPRIHELSIPARFSLSTAVFCVRLLFPLAALKTGRKKDIEQAYLVHAGILFIYLFIFLIPRRFGFVAHVLYCTHGEEAGVIFVVFFFFLYDRL